MSKKTSKGQRSRADLLEAVTRAGREFSDVAVIFHATMARLLDLHPTDYKTMSILARLGPVSVGEIAKQTGLAIASVTNLVDRLERKGFVQRVHDDEDRRRVMVHPITKRIARARRRFTSMHESLTRLLKHYSDAELAAIADFFPRMAEMFRAETAQLEKKGRVLAGRKA